MILVLDDYPLSRQGLESVIRMYRPLIFYQLHMGIFMI